MEAVKKMKLDKFKRIRLVNFPDRIDLGIRSVSASPEVVIYFVQKEPDLGKFADYCARAGLPEENRTILVFEKGGKGGLGRDTVIAPFRSGRIPGFKLKPPMLCSLSDELSAFVLSRLKD